MGREIVMICHVDVTMNKMLGCAAQSVGRINQEPEVPGLIPSIATYFCFSCC